MAEQDWLLKMLENIQRDHKESIATLRLEMKGDFDDVKGLLREQNGRVGRVETRVTIIETERGQEDKQALKRGGAVAVAASAALTGIVEIVKAVFRP